MQTQTGEQRKLWPAPGQLHIPGALTADEVSCFAVELDNSGFIDGRDLAVRAAPARKGSHSGAASN